MNNSLHSSHQTPPQGSSVKVNITHANKHCPRAEDHPNPLTKYIWILATVQKSRMQTEYNNL